MILLCPLQKGKEMSLTHWWLSDEKFIWIGLKPSFLSAAIKGINKLNSKKLGQTQAWIDHLSSQISLPASSSQASYPIHHSCGLDYADGD